MHSTSMRNLFLSAVCAAAFFAAPLSAATTIFVRVEGMNCGGTDPRHVGWFTATTFSFGISTGGAGSAPKIGDVAVVKNFDACTPRLLQQAASGRNIEQVEYHWQRSDGAVFMKILLEQVVITTVNYAAAQEAVSFNFAKMIIEYFEQRPDGSLGGSVKYTMDVRSGIY